MVAHRKLDLRRDDHYAVEFRERAWKSALIISAKPVGVGAVSQAWIQADEESSLLTLI
jgi:hypothetical protein